MRAVPALFLVLFASASLAAPSLTLEVSGFPAPLEPASLTPERRAAIDEATEVFSQRCALCHGATGRADGVMSSTLQPRPRDFSDAAWQRATSNEHIRRAILEGGAAVGKSAIMPASPDLAKKPAVLEELVGVIRGCKKRGVVRAVFVREGSAVVVQRAAGALEEDGRRAVLQLEDVAPGPGWVRGYFDADESGTRDAGEPGFARAVVVTEAPATLEIKLDADAEKR